MGDEPAREVGHDREFVPGVRRVGDEGLASQAKEIVLAHQPAQALVVDLQAVEPPEFLADSAIAVEAVLQRDGLDFVAQVGFRPLGVAKLAEAIETGAGHVRQRAQMVDRGAALRLMPFSCALIVSMTA